MLLRVSCLCLLALAVAVPVLLASTPARSATIAYWRMEVDNDATAEGLSVPNEVAGGSALVSSEAALDGVNLPVPIVTLSGATNDFSVAATRQGGANGINAAAAWYPALGVTSITVEYWARTIEATATPFRFGDGVNEGILITDPNDLDVSWVVDDGGTLRSFSMNDLYDMSSLWQHYAFTYDEVTGVATFYVDSVAVASFDGPDNAPLVFSSNPAVEAGVLMDYATAGQGTLDELRIDGSALSSAFFLPEPGAGVLLGIGLLALAAQRRGLGYIEK